MEIKHDTIKDEGFKKIYDGYACLSSGEFRLLCIDLVENSRSKKDKKLKFKNSLLKTNCKDRMLFTVNSFALSGEGLKVI